MHTRVLTNEPLTIEDINGAIKKLEKIEEMKHIVLDGEYIGDLNYCGELELNAESMVKQQQFEKLFGEAPKNDEVYIGIDYGDGVDETSIMKCILKREIKNVHKVKKGKRYIIKFDYTNVINVIGEMIKESE